EGSLEEGAIRDFAQRISADQSFLPPGAGDRVRGGDQDRRSRRGVRARGPPFGDLLAPSKSVDSRGVCQAAHPRDPPSGRLPWKMLSSLPLGGGEGRGKQQQATFLWGGSPPMSQSLSHGAYGSITSNRCAQQPLVGGRDRRLLGGSA